MWFESREAAGRKLAKGLSHYRGREDVLVIGLPRGGVAVASQVAGLLGLPLEVFILRKIAVPGDPELAVGAVSENGEVILDQRRVESFSIHPLYLESEIDREKKEIDRERVFYRDGRVLRSLESCIVIVVDEGVSSDSLMLSALRFLRGMGAKKLVSATPVTALAMMDELREIADEVVVLAKPTPFYGVSSAYQHFDKLSEEEVVQYLQPNRLMAVRR